MGVILRYSQFLETYKTRGYRIAHLKNYKRLFPIKASPQLAGVVAGAYREILNGESILLLRI
jgi:hypothetical protein